MNRAFIAPTENDIYFRKEIVQGYVHDQGAAMIGGVGGHAGVFASGLELTTLMQMNLQYGEYGGNRYLLPETVRNFTSRQFTTNRRGLGWDRPDKDIMALLLIWLLIKPSDIVVLPAQQYG